MMIQSVTCLIPAHNEALRLTHVLAAVTGHPMIARIIVIDDGSQDGTAEVAQAMGAEVLRLSPNRGKSAAIAEGLRHVTSTHVLLLDADLTGLRGEDVTCLILPVQEGRADASMSLRGNAPRLWHWLGVGYITGERVLPMALVRTRMDDMARLPRFGLEVFLNTAMQTAGLSVNIVSWDKVASPSKSVKRGRLAGIIADVAMIHDILRTVSGLTVIRQIVYFRSKQLRLAQQ